MGRVITKATPGSACFDVYSSVEVSLRPGETKKIPLDIVFNFSKKLCCRIYPRSGLSLLPTFIGGGVIDSDYWGNISVILTNFASFNVHIKIRDKTAQTLVIKPVDVNFENVEESSDVTTRGSNGFGSTDKWLICCSFSLKFDNANQSKQPRDWFFKINLGTKKKI